MTIRQGVSAALAFASLLLAAAAHGQDGTQQAALHDLTECRRLLDAALAEKI